MIMIEELHAQIHAVRDKLALAEQTGLSYDANLHRARLADLMDIAARHAIDLTAPGRTPGGTRLDRAEVNRHQSRTGSPTPSPGPTSTPLHT
jgi:hypothetical protein